MLIPKAASKSIRSVLGDERLVWEGELPARLVAFVRDPIERLQSCYRYFWKKYSLPSWPGFVDQVLAGEPDGHWMPQAQFLPAGCETYRFEDLAVVWARNGLPTLRHLNRGKRPNLPLECYREDDLRRHYRADYELRMRCA